ncbi:MAG TPA: helix-turn-helix transcriptional regulator, partial [Methylobacterium sp.]|nr:helix-turn-helix transcriptional regulator [Methylobacterium sp.]
MAGAVEQEALFLTDLGRRVRHARTVRGLSRKLLSQTSGLSERYIAQLEGGQGNVSIILLRRVANAMGVRLDDLIAGNDITPDWQVMRDLVAQASPEQIAAAKGLLAGGAPGGGSAPKPRVAVIGLRGAGKSTLGRMVADRLGWTFVELNAEIERENALSVKEIFAIYGQEGYRRLEQAALRRLTEHQGPLILATSGGIVAEPLTYDLLLQAFFTVWLKARPEEHMQRVRNQDNLVRTGD